MIPRYGEWSRKWAGRLTVVGVHSPETDGERDPGRLKRYVARHAIRWPVVPDDDMTIWDAFSIQAWPTMVLVDRHGRIQGRFVGDDEGPAIEAAIARLLGAP
ncbi:MAG TPA: hypothetical protein VMZ28_10615 [Kofleriaceae bacterium]|nr:hypothetical protein [Kofleriaceae bacterium]